MEGIRDTLALAVAKAYYKGWTSKNFDIVSALLDNDIQFEMPVNAYENKSAFIEAVKFTANNATDIQLLTELGNHSEAVLIYDFTFASVGNMRIAEWFEIKNGKIVFIRHVHDTFQLRNAGLGKE